MSEAVILRYIIDGSALRAFSIALDIRIASARK